MLRADAVAGQPEDIAQHLFGLGQVLVELAEKYSLPLMTPYVAIAEIGGLIAFGPDIMENWRYLASCVDKVLRGENPGDIPIYQSVSYTPPSI